MRYDIQRHTIKCKTKSSMNQGRNPNKKPNKSAL